MDLFFWTITVDVYDINWPTNQIWGNHTRDICTCFLIHFRIMSDIYEVLLEKFFIIFPVSMTLKLHDTTVIQYIRSPYGIRDRFYSETFKLQTNFFEVIDQYRTATGWAIDRRWKSRLESFLWKSLTEQVSIRAFVDWTLPSCQNYAKRATFQFFDWQSEWYVWVLSHVYLVLYHLSITMARRQKSYQWGLEFSVVMMIR